jgi:hypothetical protein
MRRPGLTSSFVLLFIIFGTLAVRGLAQTRVTTWHNDNGRSGEVTDAALTTTVVGSTSTFGKVCTNNAPVGGGGGTAIDGLVYAQPLILYGLNPLNPSHNTVFVATTANKIYAFDADTCAYLTANTTLLPTSESPVDCHHFGGNGCRTFDQYIGIVGTPVVDTTTNRLYVVTISQSGAQPPFTYYHRLHALDITRAGLPEVSDVPSVQVGATISNFSKLHLQRPGLLLVPGMGGGHSTVYVGFSMMDGASCGNPSYTACPNGYVFGFDATNLSQTATPFRTTSTFPDGQGGGVWMSGAGLAAGMDMASGSNYIYFSTANGSSDHTINATTCTNCGNSMVKLTTRLTDSGFFSPYGKSSNDDLDFGSGGVMLIPNNVLGSPYQYVGVTAGKDKTIYVFDRHVPGGYNSPAKNIESIVGTRQYFATPAYWNHNIYYSPVNSPITKYQVSSTCGSGTVICTNGTVSTGDIFPNGATPSTSSCPPSQPSRCGSTGQGIVWAIAGDAKTPSDAKATLRAYDASNLNPLWNSDQCVNSGRDTAGWYTKFTVPTIANGKVYIGTQVPATLPAIPTQGELDVYGTPSGACN